MLSSRVGKREVIASHDSLVDCDDDSNDSDEYDDDDEEEARDIQHRIHLATAAESKGSTNLPVDFSLNTLPPHSTGYKRPRPVPISTKWTNNPLLKHHVDIELSSVKEIKNKALNSLLQVM